MTNGRTGFIWESNYKHSLQLQTQLTTANPAANTYRTANTNTHAKKGKGESKGNSLACARFFERDKEVILAFFLLWKYNKLIIYILVTVSGFLAAVATEV